MDLIVPAGDDRRVFQDLRERPPGRYLSVTLRRKNGDEFPAETLVFEGGGAGTKWTNWIIRDVSDYRQVEEELRTRELRLRQALQVSRSFAFEWEPATDRVTRSEECAALLGLRGPEVIHDTGENFFRRVHPEDRERFIGLVRALTPDTPSYSTTYRVMRPEGGLTVLQEGGIGFFDAAQRLSLLTGISTDVTEREQSREEIVYLASFPRLNPNPIVEADLDGQPRFCNPSAERLFPDIRQRGTDHPWLSDWGVVRLSMAQDESGMFHREVAVGDRWYHQTMHHIPESRCVRIYGLDISELKATDQQRRIVHEQLVTILESISDGFFSLDRQFRVAFINERGARSIGQAREKMLDRVLWDVFPEAVGSEFEHAYRTAMTDGVATTVEAFYPPLNAWFEARAFPYGDGISVFFRDITERRSIEQALRENQADLNWAQAVGRIGSWRLNIQRNELLWSDENHRIFGLPKGAPMSYETFLGVVHPEDREYVDRKWQAALRGEPYDIEHRLVVGDAVKWVRERAELEFDADGNLLGGFGITQDITEHKLADDALRESEARFRLLARTAEELLTARHPQEHIDALAARVMTQLDCQCFFNFLVAGGQSGRLKLNAWAGIPEDEARRIEWLDYGVAVCGCAARDGVRIVAEHIPTTPDVRTELVKSYGIKAYACHPLVGVNGRVLGTLSFGTRSRETFSSNDLALMKAVADQMAVALVRMQNEQDLRSSAEALQEANERLEEKVRRRTQALEDTVATLKNEILVRKKIQAQLHHLSRKSLEALEADRRTVARELHDSIGGSLAAIKFGLEEAAERAGHDPACAGQSMGVLISHLADTIKETKRISANLRPLAIDDLGLLATIEWYTRQFCQRYETIRVVCQIDVEEQEIPEEFKIVLYRNMQEALTNVSRHSQADAVTVRLAKSATHFEFEVEDNGCGFDTSSVFGGPDRLSGYGLKSMQERAEICGGILNVRTRPNAGTSVKVSLPFSAASGFSASEADLPANHAAAGRQM
jgi:PAS domain S-box-containing protein